MVSGLEVQVRLGNGLGGRDRGVEEKAKRKGKGLTLHVSYLDKRPRGKSTDSFHICAVR